jgi:hypothetical protein
MTVAKLEALLAEKVLGWKVAADRFVMANRRWIPRWRFQPFKSLSDAFQLLDGVKPARFSMGSDGGDEFWVRIEVDGRVGEARHSSRPQAISLAIAKAVGISIDDGGRH